MFPPPPHLDLSPWILNRGTDHQVLRLSLLPLFVEPIHAVLALLLLLQLLLPLSFLVDAQDGVEAGHLEVRNATSARRGAAGEGKRLPPVTSSGRLR